LINIREGRKIVPLFRYFARYKLAAFSFCCHKILPIRHYQHNILGTRTQRNLRDASWLLSISLSWMIVFGWSAHAEDTGQATLDSTVAPGHIGDDPAARRAQLAAASEFIHKGDLARESGDLEGARTEYASAFEILPDGALSARQLKLHALDQFSATTLARANEQIAARLFSDAELLVDEVLLLDPLNRNAAALKTQFQNVDNTNPAFSPELFTNIDKVKGLLRNGNDLIGLGSFDAARESFNQVLAIDAFNTAARNGLEKVERHVMEALRSSRDHLRASMLRSVDEQWAIDPPQDLSALFGSSAGDLGGGPAKSSVFVLQKLRSIVLPRVEFLDVTLDQAISFIALRSRDLDTLEPDPEKKGIDFIVSAPEAPNVTLSLTNIRLIDLLDTIADQTVTSYAVEDYVVAFRSIAGAADVMITRTFRVPPDFLKTGASNDAEVADPFAEEGGNESELAQRMGAREFLEQNGVVFPDNSVIFYNPGTNSLVVRNTAQNIAQIELIVKQAQDSSPRNVLIELKILQTEVATLNELGYDWLLGGFNTGPSERIFAGGGTTGNQFTGELGNGADFPFQVPAPPATSSSQQATAVGVNPLTGGLRYSNALANANSIDSLLEGATTPTNQKSPALFGVAGVFSDPQFQVALRALSQKKGIDLSASPSIVAKSGQRSKISLIREFIYPTEFDPPEIPQAAAGGGGGSFPVTPTTPTTFTERDVGMTFEVEAVISADNQTIDLNLAPEYSEFEGMINYGSPILTFQGGQPIVLTSNQILQPVFRVIGMNTVVSVWNNQTIVLGGLLNDEYSTIEDKTPLFSDLPFLGSMFRSKSKKQRRKALIIFVTVKVIDPGGQLITGSSSAVLPSN
jgi:general secretion pathway protein D